VEETHDPARIYCFGDSLNFLQFQVGPMKWHQSGFDDKGIYDGTLRYSSSVFVPDRKVFMTGGCFTTNLQPSSICLSIDLKYNTGKPIKKKHMLLKRYGHQTCFLNGIIYALGGFSHKDLPNEMPVTLASCERYSIIENMWVYVSTMSEPRAFAASVILDNQYIYVFGGMHDFTVL